MGRGWAVPGYRVSDWHAAFPAQAEKGLKELIKAALEEDSDDDNKPVDLGNAPGNAPPADVLPLSAGRIQIRYAKWHIGIVSIFLN
ncbi:hypothetical protein GGX14DRAFT_563723 [Mycena pura]|uniref:Uncharacterized protein n=1 Tax=Mycena pura TaxID=153505 RepID=A0AAD6VHP6_9AGAR|nr:hypothetical protein GGX14DRAFT_563723 [Mycena pura]